MTAHDAGKLEQWVENWKKGNLHQGILKYHDWQHYKMSWLHQMELSDLNFQRVEAQQTYQPRNM